MADIIPPPPQLWPGARVTPRWAGLSESVACTGRIQSTVLHRIRLHVGRRADVIGVLNYSYPDGRGGSPLDLSANYWLETKTRFYRVVGEWAPADILWWNPHIGVVRLTEDRRTFEGPDGTLYPLCIVRPAHNRMQGGLLAPWMEIAADYKMILPDWQVVGGE